MAIYHCSVKIIGRSSGRSSVASSAYRSGEKLYNERDGLIHDYTSKTGIVHSEILIPINTPSWANDRQRLWNEVEKSERRKDSQLAREIEVAFPNELSFESRIELVREYVKENFVDNGMIADIAIHDKLDGNPHSHIMLTTRYIDLDGFGKKEREWNKKEYLEKWRQSWAEHSNRYLEKEGYEDRIDHRSYKRQGIEKIPTIHVGVSSSAMEERGIDTDRGNINRNIIKQNESLKSIANEIEVCRTDILELEKIEDLEVRVDVDKKNYYYDCHIYSDSINKNIKMLITDIESNIYDYTSIIKVLCDKKTIISEYESTIDNFIEEYNHTKFYSFKKRKELDIKIEDLECKLEDIYNTLVTDYKIEDDIKNINRLETFVEKAIILNESYETEIERYKQDINITSNLSHAYKKKYMFALIKEYEIEKGIDIKKQYKPDQLTNSQEADFERLKETYDTNVQNKESEYNSQGHKRVSLKELLENMENANKSHDISLLDFKFIEQELNDDEKDILLSIIKKNEPHYKNTVKSRKIDIER